MKICKDCQFVDHKAMQVAPGQMQMVPVCLNQECRDPVNGDPLPAVVARQQQALCGFEAKYFSIKEVKPEAQIIQLVDK